MSKTDPALTLSLRIKTLEALIGNESQDRRSLPTKNGIEDDGQEEDRRKSILERATIINQNLRDSVKGDQAVLNFLNSYPQNSPYLTPSFFLPSTSTSTSTSNPNQSSSSEISNLLYPTSSELDPLTQFSLLLEAEDDFKSLEKTLSECKNYEERKVLESEGLIGHFDLIPKLKEVKKQVEEKEKELVGVEDRLESLLEGYGNWVEYFKGMEI